MATRLFMMATGSREFQVSPKVGSTTRGAGGSNGTSSRTRKKALKLAGKINRPDICKGNRQKRAPTKACVKKEREVADCKTDTGGEKKKN